MTFASKPEAKAKLFFFPSKELEMIELKAFAPKFMASFYQNISGGESFILPPKDSSLEIYFAERNIYERLIINEA